MNNHDIVAKIRDVFAEADRDRIEKECDLASYMIWDLVRNLPEFTDYTKMEIPRMRKIRNEIRDILLNTFVQSKSE